MVQHIGDAFLLEIEKGMSKSFILFILHFISKFKVVMIFQS